MGGGVEGQAHSWSQVQVVLRDSSWRTEAEVLQQSAEEDEKLHPGQTLPQTHPATCEEETAVICEEGALEGQGQGHQPAEKGMKASRLTNFPSLSRK